MYMDNLKKAENGKFSLFKDLKMYPIRDFVVDTFLRYILFYQIAQTIQLTNFLIRPKVPIVFVLELPEVNISVSFDQFND